MWENIGKIYFDGRASLAQGSRIANSGIISFGDGFSISGNSSIVCSNRIIFGNDVMISWDSLIMDADLHNIVDEDTDEVLNHSAPIEIGEHVWVCCRTTILKGTKIGKNSIVAAGNIISGRKIGENIIIGANNRILKENINWKR